MDSLLAASEAAQREFGFSIVCAQAGGGMTNETLPEERKSGILTYEDSVPIRGYFFKLPEIKLAFREFLSVTKGEADRLVDGLPKIENETDADYANRKKLLKDQAFRITVSIVGYDGQVTYGDTEAIFDSDKISKPIRTIFFTNVTAFRPHANGDAPMNRFEVLLKFDKPPLVDPSPLVSQPTQNESSATVNAEHIGYFRAIRNIIDTRLKSNRQWYYFLHEKFVYDIGLWFVALPYSLYWATVYMDYWFNSNGDYSSFRIPFFIYALGISLIIYRILTGYVKWAFPVNVLEENDDRATQHRFLLGTIVMGLIVAGVVSLVGI